MESILDTLIFDGKAELSARTTGASGVTSGDTSVKIYRAVKPLSDTSALVRTPCGVCPVSEAFLLINQSGVLWQITVCIRNKNVVFLLFRLFQDAR